VAAATVGAVDVLLAVEQLVGRMPLVVSGGFMLPSILAVILGCPGLAEQFGRVSRLTIGPGGALVPSGGALMLASALGALVLALVVVGHSSETSCVSGFGDGGPRRADDGIVNFAPDHAGGGLPVHHQREQGVPMATPPHAGASERSTFAVRRGDARVLGCMEGGGSRAPAGSFPGLA
jgi:hypothetical protein